MSEPFIGEIRMFAGNFAPRGWAFCAGQLVAISSNEALFSILGTTYGGDGRTTFGLPDLRGRVPVHAGTGPGLPGRTLGQRFGQERVGLTANELPSHSHDLPVQSGSATTDNPSGAVIAGHPSDDNYATAGPDTNMAAASIGPPVPAAGGQPHDNIQPSQSIYFIIALVGVYPSRS